MWITAGVATALAIAMTPLLLQLAASGEKDWDELSKVSQAYGALSVLFSAAALLGVVASLVHQSRQIKVANEEAQRASHRQLLLASVEDPELTACWEPVPVTSQLERKQTIFVNLIVSNWFADYRLKRVNDDTIRVLAELHFSGEVARRHWQLSGTNWRNWAGTLEDRRPIRFVSLLDEAYLQAVAAGPPIPHDSHYSSTG
ncbi:DUF6082 family protein [Streptomyces sp. NRRL B-1140]|uniref:DUF6082 family protein n=1 Tax=Streptomyces sp. NRRL B-1140 TaxID=1415549 RepID=UPI00131AE21B|nr:DUF6082 family protein [Streptomyces sp. NRRL B-1140]